MINEPVPGAQILIQICVQVDLLPPLRLPEAGPHAHPQSAAARK